MSPKRRTAPPPASASANKRHSASTPLHDQGGFPVAFLGLGAMGRPMALRLAEAGFSVRAYNRTPLVAQAAQAPRDRFVGLLAKAGATIAPSPAECARGARVIVTMLSDAEALASVLEGREGVFSVLGSGAGEKRRPRPVLVDMSTIGRRAAVRLGGRAEERGARFVDAPVSGSVGPASRGELVALVGGPVRSVERARPVLEVLCKKIIHAGPIGAGQALKVVLNGLGAHHLVAFTSMLALGQRAGLSRSILLDAFTTGAFATPSYVGKREKLLARDFTPEFSLALALKDCLLAADLQEEVGLSLPVHGAIASDVAAGVREGLGDLDLFVLENHYAKHKSD